MYSVKALLGIASFALLFSPAAANADHAPVIVVPGRAGVPVVIDGRDVTGAVIEGDWGLTRPGHGQLTVIPFYRPAVILGPPPAGYYPSTGHKPRSGRREIEPPANRRLPPPAEPYFRSWGVQSDFGPPLNPPPVILVPRSETPGLGR